MVSSKYFVGRHVLLGADVFADNTLSALDAKLRRAERNVAVFETGHMFPVELIGEKHFLPAFEFDTVDLSNIGLIHAWEEGVEPDDSVVTFHQIL